MQKYPCTRRRHAIASADFEGFLHTATSGAAPGFFYARSWIPRMRGVPPRRRSRRVVLLGRLDRQTRVVNRLGRAPSEAGGVAFGCAGAFRIGLQSGVHVACIGPLSAVSAIERAIVCMRM